MKKILLILIIGMITSCTYKEVTGETEIPLNIMVGIGNNTLQADTLIFAKDNHYHYYFHKVNDVWVLNEKYNIDHDNVNLDIVLLLLIIAVSFILGLFFGRFDE